MIFPAQEGGDVLVEEFEEIQYVRPVEETLPPPQDLPQLQVGLGIKIDSTIVYYFNIAHCCRVDGSRQEQ